MKPGLRGLAAILFALPLAAHAATAPATTQPAPTIPVPSTSAPPPYEDQLLRLSEILGAIHYLRELCKADDSDVWRDEMQKLLDAEQPDPDRRARMVGRFNHGYDSFRSVYLACTPAATEAISRYLDEGQKITTDITARYGR
jgi:uncharacterized protein (TIGR02301 family)